jgi:outer membrane receptor protein involved in Fe transport
MKFQLTKLLLLFCAMGFAQSTIKGKVTDDAAMPLPGASIIIVGEKAGTTADNDGNFTLTTQKNPPFTIEVSSIGFKSTRVNITSKNQTVTASLSEDNQELGEVVVSASRAPERILESPVTIERMGIKEVKNTTSPTFYEGLENMKEVHFNTSSFNFKSINTRGFATIANTRFMQLVDGMDNSSPALNFVLGNLIGLNDLDVQNVELLPGASSALYGANAFNGILFMNSKNPFEFQGISAYVKRGITQQEIAGTNEFLDLGVRAAWAFTPHFAVKANFTHMRATEWIAADARDVNGGAVGFDVNPNYEGLNTYGGTARASLRDVGLSLAAAGLLPAAAVNLLPNESVARTGYREQDLSDNQINNTKFDASMHFRPFATSSNEYWKSLEVVAQHKLGLGNTVYQGGSRYALRNFYMNQTRAEITHKNFFIRGYLSAENAGDSYDMRFAAINMNRIWKPDATWFGQYAATYVQASGLNPNLPQNDLHALARSVADQGRFLPGTPEYANALNTVRQSADVLNGAKFIDRSRIWHGDWNYNFKDQVKVVDLQVGGSYRSYVLNSEGTIFTDKDGPIRYDEYGVYTQVQKKLLNDRLKFTGSIRYDKSELFAGQFSPRVSLVYSAGARKNHNFRASFQTGFRNPTTQDLFIGLNVGPRALVGSAASNLTRYTETFSTTSAAFPLSAAGAGIIGSNSVTISGVNAYNNAFSSESVTAFLASGNVNDLRAVRTNLVKPEQVKAFEVGYKSSIKGFNIDINGYYNIYNDFLSAARVIAPLYGTAGNDPTNAENLRAISALTNRDRRTFDLYTNSLAEITSYGVGVGVSKKIYKEFEISANYNFAGFQFDESKDPAFRPSFNTPEHRAKFGLNNDNLFKNFGFGVNGRWWSQYEWQSTFGDGLIPSTVVVDAQISYAIPSLKSVIKVTGSNIGNNDYLQVIGAGMIGQIYTIGITVNP